MTSNETWRRLIGAVESETGVLIGSNGAKRICEKMNEPTGARHGDKFAASVRSLVNNTWTDAPMTRAEAEELAGDKTERETGPRVVVRCVLPVDEIAEGQDAIFYDLERDLEDLAGGWTAFQSQGAWANAEQNTRDIENGRVYEVCVLPHKVERAIKLFEASGYSMEQTWTHITTHIVEARHARTDGAS